MKLSIVATLYQSAPYINEFYQRVTAAAVELVGDAYEIVLVNDGSPDNCLTLAIALTEHDPHVVLIDLSRNFGHHKAMMTGLAHARGEHIFLIDTDLEEDPEYLLSFSSQMLREKCDVVYGVQERRKGDWFERWSGNFFWKITSYLSGLPIPHNQLTARLMTRRYVDALLLHEESELFIAGLWFITGFEQNAQVARKHQASKSTYTIRKKFSLLVNSITSFSNLPLVGIFYIGASIFTIALIYTLYLLLNSLFFSTPLAGWTSVMASIWLLGGGIISIIGIIGIYLAKIFLETKNRPYSIIRSIYGRK